MDYVAAMRYVALPFLAVSFSASQAFAADAKVLAVYPMVVACFLVLVLALFFYDNSRRKTRNQQIANANEVQRLQYELGLAQEEVAVLKASHDSLELVIQHAPVLIWQRDERLALAECNDAYRNAISDVNAANGVIAELDKKSKGQAQIAVHSKALARDRRHIIVAGERKLFEIVEVPMPDGKTTAGFAFDLAEVDALKEDLERHNSAMNDFLESSASAMAIYGPDMRLKSFNYAFVALWKLDEMWLDTHPTYGEILENLREKRKLPEQANFQLFKQQQQKLFRDLIEPREEFFYLPDGKALRVLAIPHALGGVMFAYEDVTDRLALERSYNTLIAVQRETLDNLHEGVAVFGEDGRLKLSNPNYVQLWGLTTEFARAEPHVRDIVDKCKPLYKYTDWDAYKQSHLQQMQIREARAQHMERADGKVIDWRKVPLPDGATLITYMDITDSTKLERSLRERNDALQEADKLKTEFLANVSYELRSPLTSIAGFSEMLSQEYFGPLSEKQKEYVDGIHQSSQRLMQLINDILDLASIEAGYMRLEVSRFDVYGLMKSVSSLIQERAKEYGIKFKFDCPTKIGRMLGDETRIKQILFNLLSNAIKFSQSGGVLTFGAKADGDDKLIIWVQDEGQGISPEEQEAVFNKFHKGKLAENSKTKTAQRSGTGLGLSIVKSFVDLHGGEIRLISAPDKGTRFECHFERENSNLVGTKNV